MKKIRLGKFIVGMLVILFGFLLIPEHVSAAEIKTYPITATVEQNGPRSMLDMINDFRTGPDAWYYNQAGQKVYVNCAPLSYDYDLEQIALQRAYEIAFSFSHTRPNGESCFSCTYNGTSSNAENIAAGYSTAESVFTAWREDNYGYSGQGHRRNMLNEGYKSVGIAHVVYNGYHFWVQEFSFYSSNAPYTDPINGKRTGSLDIDTGNVSFKLDADKKNISGDVGNSGNLPKLQGFIKTSESWPSSSGGLTITSDYLSSVKWASSNSSVVQITGNKYKLTGSGSATLTGSTVFNGKTYSCLVSVEVSGGSSSVADEFDDINGDEWFVPYIQFVYDRGIMSGKGRNFDPNGKIKREELTQIIYSHAGKPEVSVYNNMFLDVPDDAWYCKGIVWCSNKSIVGGIGNGRFGVGQNVTREDFALMLFKYAQYRNMSSVNNINNNAYKGYKDSDKVSSYAIKAMNWAITNGIMGGKGNPGSPKSELSLDPKGNATRAEGATMIMKFIGE